MTFCYECTISPIDGGGPYTFKKDSITVTQNALDCSIALSDAGFTNPLPIAYDSGGSSVTISSGYTAIFNHVNIADCPL